MKEYTKNFSNILETVTINLETLELGDCEGISKRCVSALKRFSNLKSLRLENCFDKFNKIALDVFDAIKSLKGLSKLELINIKFTEDVSNELRTCKSIQELLIIPDYTYQVRAII